jgi:predicted glycosyl hydrolase (DUF1957 family)
MQRIMTNNTNFVKCSQCELSVIAGERHECPLAGAKFVGYVLINGHWYINSVMRRKRATDDWGGCEDEYLLDRIEPIRVPSYLTSYNYIKNNNYNKNKNNSQYLRRDI